MKENGNLLAMCGTGFNVSNGKPTGPLNTMKYRPTWIVLIYFSIHLMNKKRKNVCNSWSISVFDQNVCTLQPNCARRLQGGPLISNIAISYFVSVFEIKGAPGAHISVDRRTFF